MRPTIQQEQAARKQARFLYQIFTICFCALYEAAAELM